MSTIYSSKDKDKLFKPYEYIYINNFNVNNIAIKKDKNEDGSFNNTIVIQYNKNGFYLVPVKCFKSYGIKTFESYGEELNKVSIIFEDDNKHHNIYKNILEKLYKKVDTSLKKINVSINPPFSEKKYNTIDLNITKFTKFYVYKDIEVNPIALNNICSLSNIPFKISPIIYLKKLTIKDNKTYFNFMIKEAYIQFEKPIVPFDTLQNMFQIDSNEYGDSNSTTIEDDDYL